MNATVLGLITGLALGFAAAFGGIGAFLLVAVLGAVGLALGRHVDGAIDLRALVGVASDRGDRR